MKIRRGDILYADLGVQYTHEAIVSYSQYIKAVSSLKQQKAAESGKRKNIYYCGYCGRAMYNAHYGMIFCRHTQI